MRGASATGVSGSIVETLIAPKKILLALLFHFDVQQTECVKPVISVRFDAIIETICDNVEQ